MGAWLIQQGKTLSYSTLIGYATLASVIVNGFIGVSVFIMIIPQVRVSINRVNEILNTKVTIADGNEAKQKFVGRGEIEFKNVSFKYGGAKENVLSDISFKANSGDFIGVVGPIGCGKSTLLNLIPRFMDPTSGEIIIDNVNIKNMKLATLREKLGFSLQRANLLNRTVYENIGIGIKGTNVVDATKKIELAADVSQAKPFIEEMEQKYNYMISQNSVNISGGQKQRIVIAQSIANEPEIMLFDDSFSALDYKTDSLVRKEIFAKYKKSTKIIVASRISTIIKANKIIVLNNGNIVDIGTHKQLFSRCEFYRNITLQQMSTEEALRD
jgi:ATP-binding cassette subfamily B protein